nr:uncharacterized protein LOC109180484 [Ipomoea batatas]
MRKNLVILLLILLILLLGCSSASATPTAKMVCGVVTNVVAAVFKWLVSLKSEMEPAFSRIKFEKGYNIETIFDGNKLGVEPYSVEVSPPERSSFWILKTATFTRSQHHTLCIASLFWPSDHLKGALGMWMGS